MQIWETKNITLFDKAKYITGKSMFVGIYAYYIVIGKYLLNQLGSKTVSQIMSDT